jgi:hypothetical protein
MRMRVFPLARNAELPELELARTQNFRRKTSPDLSSYRAPAAASYRESDFCAGRARLKGKPS